MGGKQKEKRFSVSQKIVFLLLARGLLACFDVLGSNAPNTFEDTVITLKNIYGLAYPPPKNLKKFVSKYYNASPWLFMERVVSGSLPDDIENPGTVKKDLNEIERFQFFGEYIEEVPCWQRRLVALAIQSKMSVEEYKKQLLSKLNEKNLSKYIKTELFNFEKEKVKYEFEQKRVELEFKKKKKLLELDKKKLLGKKQSIEADKEMVHLEFAKKESEFMFKKEIRLLEREKKNLKTIFAGYLNKKNMLFEGEGSKELSKLERKIVELKADKKKKQLTFKKEMQLLKLNEKNKPFTTLKRVQPSKVYEDQIFILNTQKKQCKNSKNEILKFLQNERSAVDKKKKELKLWETRLLKLDEQNKLLDLDEKTWLKLKKEGLLELNKAVLKNTNINAGKMFGHLVFRNLFKNYSDNGFKYLRRPTLYGIDVTGKTFVSDKRYVLYEKKLSDDFKPLKSFLLDQKTIEKFFPIEALREVLYVCENLGTGGSWKLHSGSLFVNPKEKDAKKRFIVVMCVGQPDTTKQEQFFNADWNAEDPRKSLYLWSVVKGLCNLYKDFTWKKYREEIKCFVETKKRLRGANNYGELETLLLKT